MEEFKNVLIKKNKEFIGFFDKTTIKLDITIILYNNKNPINE
jgi:hypothetical protein